jgi:hypothetical protein
MPWVRLDDRFPSHRKIRLLTDRAFRLYVSGLCYASENLTDGLIPADELRIVADIKSSKAAAKELVERDLWELLDSGDFQIHDYLDFNPSAEQVIEERAAKTARQARWRANKKKRPTPPKPPREGSPVDASTSTSTDASRDGGETPAPYPYPSSSFRTAAARENSGQAGIAIPDWAQPLIDELGSKSIHVSWRLSAMQWAAVQELINTRGVPFLVEQARRRWNPKDPIKFASLLIQIWAEIPAPPRISRNASPQADTPPHCGHIDCDPLTRTRDEDAPNGLRVSVRCPECHPSRKDTAA